MTSLPLNPQDWPALFEQRVNYGNIQGAIELYDPTARIVPPSSENSVGIDEVRKMLTKLIEEKVRFESRVVRTVVVGDIALLHTDWTITTNETATKASHRAIEILRRQVDGAWKLIIGEPDGQDG
jgi:uncharacterized protein (TIGR02246 family)